MGTPTGSRADFSFTLHAPAPPERVFPLLCPVREYEWIDGWACDLIHSESGVVEPGCIFATERAGEGRTIWVTTVHDPVARRIEFVRITPGSHVVVMRLSVAAAAEGHAEITIAYQVTALDGRGVALLEAARHDGGGVFAQTAAGLERSLQHFLATGTKLPRGQARPG